jgi:hypothetical protein
VALRRREAASILVEPEHSPSQGRG